MKSLLRLPSTLLLTLTALLLAQSFSFGQAWAPTQVAADIKDVNIIMQKTPQFDAQVSDSKKDGKRREYLEVEVEFETKSNSKIKIVPELMIQYYLAVKGIEQQVLTDSYRYRNIEDDEEAFSIVYVSPASLTQIAGEKGKFKESDVVAWGVEILYKGRVVATASSSGNKPWWTATNAQTTSGLMMPKEKTPFQLLWIDRHAETILD
tara:strand:+ start:9268 stop:9888 length:621 start_codon:yes stop_codon:yes gene_type:complete